MKLKSMIYIACCMTVMSCGPQKKKAMEETEVLIETSMGDMKVKLYNDTPKHRDNFIKLARAGAYDNICFIVSYEALWCRPETRLSNPGE